MCDSRYYDGCNGTAPENLPPWGKNIPFGKFSTCESALSGINCADAQYGFPSLPASLYKTAAQPNGTGTYTNQGGVMTSPPYGSTTAWYFYGSTGTAGVPVTATAVPYKAVAGSTGTNSGGLSPGSTGKASTSNASGGLITGGTFGLAGATLVSLLLW
jgi:hypothetical protein